MRLKTAVLVYGSVLVVFIILTIYSAKDLSYPFPKGKSLTSDFRENKWLHFEDRIKNLENDLNRHHNIVHEIKETMKDILKSHSPLPVAKSGAVSFVKDNITHSNMLYESTCPIELKFVPKTNIQMLDLYKVITFDNPDGGVWKQGWKIEVDEKDWNREHKLKVFVVPHSHNDPGWIKTIEEYYATQTKHILDNMLTKLPEDTRRKFIWAEISYFSMWWDDLEDDAREKVKWLVHNNQLEIVTGGWVMNDEANAHWLAILHQLTEGHQWLQTNLNYTPTSHWSIDPFGMSLTQPMLLKEMGIDKMLMQRIHYSVKKQLARQQQLEFRWRQLWDSTGKTEVFTHMMPFYSYDIPHTCGPNPKVCCQFDFKRLPNHGLYCPWKIPPKPITDTNVAERALLLLDQYRKKSKLFQTNVVLAPLGDDFRYDHPTEWDVQYNNYQKLFDYMNSNLNLNVKAQFGTLSDYFAAVLKEQELKEFPTLTGDFFTYADRDDHYWSGYYTSRPFYKRMDRILLSYIRAAEMIHGLTYLSKPPSADWIVERKNGLETMFTIARQSLALFQHHDAITGTAKDHVVIDYGKKLLHAINSCQKIIQLCAHILLSKSESHQSWKDTIFYNVDDIRHSFDALPEHYQITIGVPEMRTKRIVIYNSLTFTRHEVVTFHVSTPFVEVRDFRNELVKCQVSPVFENGVSMSLTKYQLSFVANIPALSLVSYVINALWERELPSSTVFSTVKIFNHYGEVRAPNGFNPEVSPNSNEFNLHNARLTASFNKFGLLKALKTGTTTIPVHLDFAKYGVRNRPRVERSGAYLFLPDGEAVPLQIENVVVNIIEGPIMSSVAVRLPYVQHTITLFDSPGADSLGIEIENVVDIEKTNNFELVMRLQTNIDSSQEFFTDVNGYQVMRRKLFKKLPLQANYYPIPTMAYIEDSMTRLSIVTSSPLGCSSLASGQFEVMLDRRLNQDDNLGMGQGVLDNRPTRHVFRVLLEKRLPSCESTAENHPAGVPSISTYVASQTLLNPLIKLLRVDDEDDLSHSAYSPVGQHFGVDYSMVSLKTNVLVKGRYHLGFVLHRQYLDVCFSDKLLLQQFPLSDGKVNVSALLPIDSSKRLYRASLSFLTIKEEVDMNVELPMCPMEMHAYVI